MSKLYFVAFLLPPKQAEELRSFQWQAAELFHSKRALRNPPHITLLPPFRFPSGKHPRLQEDEAEKSLIKRLQTFAERPSTKEILSRLKIRLEDFGFFAPRVVFVNVYPDKALLQLQADLQKATAELTGFPETPHRPFHPHVTVAYRDLSKEQFPRAKRHFEKLSYRTSFKAEAFHLLKHENRRWKVIW